MFIHVLVYPYYYFSEQNLSSQIRFCFVNDIVLAVHTLASEFTRILYIDLDVHHGDGVENAFLFTDKGSYICIQIFSHPPGSTFNIIKILARSDIC